MNFARAWRVALNGRVICLGTDRYRVLLPRFEWWNGTDWQLGDGLLAAQLLSSEWMAEEKPEKCGLCPLVRASNESLRNTVEHDRAIIARLETENAFLRGERNRP